MGWRFTVNTFIAVSIVSFAVDHLYHVIQIAEIHALYAALLGGGLIGTGMLVIFRHKMSLGGFNILALFLQERFGIRAGKVQMALDCTIVAVLMSGFFGKPLLAKLLLNSLLFKLVWASENSNNSFDPNL